MPRRCTGRTETGAGARLASSLRARERSGGAERERGDFSVCKPDGVWRTAAWSAADLTVVGGAGHVGIPLVLAFAEAGLSRQRQRPQSSNALETLRSGRLPFIEHGARGAARRGARATSGCSSPRRPAEISHRAPSSSPSARRWTSSSIRCASVMQECIDALLPHLADGQLLVLRSTVFPGTTEWIDGYLKRKGRDAQGRVLPGAHGAGPRHQGAEGNAADHQRHDAGGRAGGGGSCFAPSLRSSSS